MATTFNIGSYCGRTSFIYKIRRRCRTNLGYFLIVNLTSELFFAQFLFIRRKSFILTFSFTVGNRKRINTFFLKNNYLIKLISFCIFTLDNWHKMASLITRSTVLKEIINPKVGQKVNSTEKLQN